MLPKIFFGGGGGGGGDFPGMPPKSVHFPVAIPGTDVCHDYYRPDESVCGCSFNSATLVLGTVTSCRLCMLLF